MFDLYELLGSIRINLILKEKKLEEVPLFLVAKFTLFFEVCKP